MLTAPRPLPPDLLDQLKAHKPDLLAALTHPDRLPPVPRGLGSAELLDQILARPDPVPRGLGGYATPPGVPPLGDCALARQVAAMPEGDPVPSVAEDHGPGCTVTAITALPTASASVLLEEVLAAACDGVAGISPAQFRALLSPEDVADIEAGDLSVETLRAYAESFAEGMGSGRIGAPEVKP